MSTIYKYIVFAALCLGALAIAPGAAEASTLTSRTQPWCKIRGPEDVHVISSASATLTWKPSGDLVLEPTNHFVPQIWSSGTGGNGHILCMTGGGALEIYNLAGARIWVQSGSSVPSPPPFWPSFDYVVELSLRGCTLSARYKMYMASPSAPPPSSTLSWQPTGSLALQGQLWTKAGTCPEAAPSVTKAGWCMDTSANRTIAHDGWAKLRWMMWGQLVLSTSPGIRGNTQIWAVPGNTQIGKKLCFEANGRLAIYNEHDQVVWQTSAGATTTSHLLEIDDCNVAIKPLDGSAPLWSNQSRCPQTRMFLLPGEVNKIDVPVGDTDVVLTENDQARLLFQRDGNLVLRSVSGDEVWHSALASWRGKRLSLQADGNLVIYDSSNQALWASGTNNQGVTILDLDGCAFALKSQTATRYYRGAPTCPTDTLTNMPHWSISASGTQTLLRTPDARLVWQADGNLVLYTATGAPVWASNTNGRGKALAFQFDGNLVVYRVDGTITPADALWSSGTWISGGASHRLRLGSQCTLTVEDTSSAVRWTGNNSCTVVNYTFERADGNSTFGVVTRTHLTAKDNGTARLDSHTAIDLTIFDSRVEVFSATAYQTEVDNGSSLQTASVTIRGESAAAVNIGYSHVFFAKTQTFSVGPVPVTVTASATGELGLGLSASGGALAVTPSAGLYATLQAGVGAECDLGGASAGIRGSLTLLELALPISLKLYIENGQPRYSISGDLTISTLSGSLSLYAEAFVKVWFAEVKASWSHSIFRWTGLEWTKNLFKRSGGF